MTHVVWSGHPVYANGHLRGETLVIEKLMADKYRLRLTADQRVLRGKIAGIVTVKV